MATIGDTNAACGWDQAYTKGFRVVNRGKISWASVKKEDRQLFQAMEAEPGFTQPSGAVRGGVKPMPVAASNMRAFLEGRGLTNNVPDTVWTFADDTPFRVRALHLIEALRRRGGKQQALWERHRRAATTAVSALVLAGAMQSARSPSIMLFAVLTFVTMSELVAYCEVAVLPGLPAAPGTLWICERAECDYHLYADNDRPVGRFRQARADHLKMVRERAEAKTSKPRMHLEKPSSSTTGVQSGPHKRISAEIGVKASQERRGKGSNLPARYNSVHHPRSPFRHYANEGTGKLTTIVFTLLWADLCILDIFRLPAAVVLHEEGGFGAGDMRKNGRRFRLRGPALPREAGDRSRHISEAQRAQWIGVQTSRWRRQAVHLGVANAFVWEQVRVAREA